MYFFYVVALLITLAGLFFWWRNGLIVCWEWLASAGLAWLMALMFHGIAIKAQTSDEETFSGRLVKVTHYPYWQDKVRVEDYEDESYTDSDGNRKTRRVHVGHHYEYNDHPEYFEADSFFGQYLSPQSYKISESFYKEIVRTFGGKRKAEQPSKPDFYKGDKNIYVTANATAYCWPVTHWVAFENRLKASPSLYSFSPVPPDAQVFPYPANKDPFKSDRLLGTAAKTISSRDLDVINAEIGPTKKVNIIMVGFGDKPSDVSRWQEAAWIGGKKNDLVLCYGGPDPFHPSWTYVFGWSDSTLVKANLSTILLQNPIDATILPKIAEEVVKNYKIKEWRDFNYLEVEPPTWSYWVYILTLVLVQGGLWYWLLNNDQTKDGSTGGFKLGSDMRIAGRRVNLRPPMDFFIAKNRMK